MRSSRRPASRPAFRYRRLALATQFRRNIQPRFAPMESFWRSSPNAVRCLCFLVRQILKFHESEPLLATPGPPDSPSAKTRSRIAPSPSLEERAGERRPSTKEHRYLLVPGPLSPKSNI